MRVVPQCECGMEFLIHREWRKATSLFLPYPQYMACCNQECRLYGVPFAMPTVALHRADPQLVERVRADELEREEVQRKQPKWEGEWEGESRPF